MLFMLVFSLDGLFSNHYLPQQKPIVFIEKIPEDSNSDFNFLLSNEY